ncbi:ACP S-malonyltransferase [Erythrobacter arachoides]|uniref:Malonyl CoA-acyl carrier protein transacylase n=1 Tax=Aurantiacibacter arachoides TaxID=1850444 RepID=A0A845A1J8_9SPHN|nr:ACP S-malonyltransferase [Aurantiacibacter arachoides]MXO93440.1 ACP S-malonyltransferase [Aurantiacibacter arachoides]GGD49366.1 malonyl CoA-acyl carrier protein transacylase [Aurantiacibacter arachoides]
MIAFLFPGQGSQKIGMGHDLAQASSHAREVFEEVDDALNQKLFALMGDGPESELTMTANAQPAIMANALAVVRVLEAGGFVLSEKGAAVAGHSLGEYSALASVGAFDLASTARLLRTRGIAMQDAVPIGVGGMCALLGADLDKAQALADAAAQGPLAGGADSVCEVANDNDPGQVVLSGHLAAIDRAVELAKEHGIKRAIKLPVSAPFHCSLMQPAAQRMRTALGNMPPAAFRLPVYSNVTAAPVTDPAEEQRLLVEQITGRVRWRESVAAMHAAGTTHFVELGGKVVGPMVKKIAPDAMITSVVGMEDIEALAKTI